MENRTKSVKIDVHVRKEIKQYSLIVDSYGNFFKLPYIDKSHRKHLLKPIKPHFNVACSVIRIDQKRINLNRILDYATDVKYKMRFEILKKNVPENYTTIIEK